MGDAVQRRPDGVRGPAPARTRCEAGVAAAADGPGGAARARPPPGGLRPAGADEVAQRRRRSARGDVHLRGGGRARVGAQSQGLRRPVRAGARCGPRRWPLRRCGWVARRRGGGSRRDAGGDRRHRRGWSRAGRSRTAIPMGATAGSDGICARPARRWAGTWSSPCRWGRRGRRAGFGGGRSTCGRDSFCATPSEVRRGTGPRSSSCPPGTWHPRASERRPCRGHGDPAEESDSRSLR